VKWLDFLATGPQGDLFMIGKTKATLQRNVLNDIRDIVGESNYKWINRQEGELRLFNRRVYCIGGNNEESESKIRGATIAGAYCDEVSLYPEPFFNQLMARMSVDGAQAFANCNPDTPFHWFYRNYIMNPAIINKKVWHFTMDDNLSLTEEYKRSLSQMYTGVFKRRLIDGEWCAAEGAVYDMFDLNKHVKRLKLAKTLADDGEWVIGWYVSCDYGTSTVTTFSLFAELAGGRFYKRGEYYYDAAGTNAQKTDGEFLKDFKAWLASYPEAVNSIMYVYCDPAAASWKAELSQAGYIVINANNDVINGIRVVSSYLTQCKFFIDPTCENTLKEYSNYSWDPNAQKLGIDRPIKMFDHTCDCDRYTIYTRHEQGLAGAY
jgi:PBSX family phage terminase large subunit